MLIFDGDYPMAFGAIEINRDLTLPLEEVRAAEGDSEVVAMASLPELRRARIAAALVKFTVRRLRRDSVASGYRGGEAAYGAAKGQVAYYHVLAQRGEAAILTTGQDLARHMDRWEGEKDAEALPVGFILGMEGADPILWPDQVHGVVGRRGAGGQPDPLRTQHLRLGHRHRRRTEGAGRPPAQGDGKLRHAARPDPRRRRELLGSPGDLLRTGAGKPSELSRAGPGSAPVQRRAARRRHRARRGHRCLHGYVDDPSRWRPRLVELRKIFAARSLPARGRNPEPSRRPHRPRPASWPGTRSTPPSAATPTGRGVSRPRPGRWTRWRTTRR